MPEDEKKHPGTPVWEKGEENQQISVRWDDRRHECRTEDAFLFFSFIDKGRSSNVPLAFIHSLSRDSTTASKDETREKKF